MKIKFCTNKVPQGLLGSSLGKSKFNICYDRHWFSLFLL